MPKLLTDKYKPKTSTELLQKTNATAIKEFIQNYDKQQKKSVFIYGGPGTGKTSTIHALANELELELIELNASDFRNSEQIQNIIGSAIKQKSLFYKGKVILVDEVDGIAGNKDRGGIVELNSLIDNSKYAIILTANNPWDSKLSTLRTKSLMIGFKSLTYLNIFSFLKSICEQEKISYDADALKTISRRCGGDLRSALNDVQSLIQKGITKETAENLGERNRIESVFNALMKIFKSNDLETVKTALDDLEEDLDVCFLWIEENMPKEYSDKSLLTGVDMLSKADIFRKRIIKTQHWRFLSYINTYLTTGVALAKDPSQKKGFIRYAPSTRILKIWRARQAKGKKQFFEKLSKYTHCSNSKTTKEIMPYLQFILKKNKKKTEELKEELKLDEDSMEFMEKI